MSRTDLFRRGTASTSPNTVDPGSSDLASRRTRFIAHSLDAFVASVPSAITMMLIKVGLLPGSAAAASIGLGFLYLAFRDGMAEGQSLGKRWLGIRVVDEISGAPCSYFQSFGRNCLMGLGPIDAIVIFGEGRQRLGDKVANTIVIEADD